MRLVVTTGAVALGVGLLLIALAGMNAINAQNVRTAWLTATFGPGPGPNPTSDPLWWLSSTDQFGNETIYRVDVAATGPNSPVPPGISHLPGPGEFFASPALTRLLRSTPAAELADRFSGTDIGTIGPSALPSPNSLIIVTGHTPGQLSEVPGSERIASSTPTPGSAEPAD